MKRQHSKIPAILRNGLLFLGCFCCAWPVFPADVTIAWDANAEADIRGYNIYFQPDSDGPPYTLYGYIDLLDIDPANPAVVVTGLSDDAVYYLTVTALDTEGYESVYSNSVCVHIIGDAVQPCSTGGGTTGDGGSTGGSGGGGGGGCFIGLLIEDRSRTRSTGAPFDIGDNRP
jgi:hypothetical protein